MHSIVTNNVMTGRAPPAQCRHWTGLQPPPHSQDGGHLEGECEAGQTGGGQVRDKGQCSDHIMCVARYGSLPIILDGLLTHLVDPEEALRRMSEMIKTEAENNFQVSLHFESFIIIQY